MTRREDCIRLHEQGLSYSKIAKKYGVTRQRIEQIIHHDPIVKYQNKYAEVKNAAIREWLIKNMVRKGEMPQVVWRNIKRNKLTKRTVKWVVENMGISEDKLYE